MKEQKRRRAPSSKPVLALALVAGLGAWALDMACPQAAVTGNNIITAQTPNRGLAQFLQGTDTAGVYKTLYVAGNNGSKCWGMWASNSDLSNAHTVTVQVQNSAIKYGGTLVTVPIGAGFVAGTPPQALSSPALWPGLPVDSDGNSYLALNYGDSLVATFATGLTSATSVNVIVTCSDY